MTKKPILTKEQFEAKVKEFNDIPKEDRLLGMRFALDNEHTRDLISYAWDFSKKEAEKKGITDLERILQSFTSATIKSTIHDMGAPEPIVELLTPKLLQSTTLRGMLWHVLIEVAPEEDVVLLTGNFDVYSEVSNGK